jgi:hypothetical protein
MSYSLAPDGMMYSLPLPQLEEAQVSVQHIRMSSLPLPLPLPLLLLLLLLLQCMSYTAEHKQ